MLLHFLGISSQQSSQAIQVSQLFPQDLEDKANLVSEARSSLLPGGRAGVLCGILPAHRFSVPALSGEECQTPAGLSGHKRDWREVGA